MNIHPHISRATRYTLFSLILGAALALSLIRFWLIPQAHAYRSNLQQQIASLLDTPVRIGALSGWMHGFNPQLVLDDFVLLDPETQLPTLAFGHVRVDLSLWRSVLQARPILKGIVLEHARLTVQRRDDGTFGIAGLNGGDASSSWLQEEGQFELRDIELSWQDLEQAKPAMQVGRLDLTLRNSTTLHSLNLSLASLAKPSAALHLAAEIRGSLLSPATWQARAYLEGKRVSSQWLSLLPTPLSLKAGAASFKVWGTWRDAEPDRLAGQIELSEPIVAHQIEPSRTRQLALHQAQGRFDWHALPAGWQLDIDRFSLSLYDRPWPKSSLSVALTRDAQGNLASLSSAVSYFRLEDARTILHTLSLPDMPLLQPLLAAAPKGELIDFRAIYSRPAPNGDRWGLCGDVKQAGLKPAGSLPGFDHLDARICGNDRHGELSLNLRDTALQMADLWRDPVPLTQLTAAFGWQQTAEKWRVESRTLTAEAPGLHALGQMQLDLPKTAEASPWLNFKGALSDIDAVRLRQYLPLAAMGKNTAAWLGAAFHAGRIRHADLLVQGRLDDFPFREGEGVCEALVEIEGFEVEFDPAWPHLHELKGQLMFQGAALSMQATAGRIGDVPFRAVLAETPDLDRDPWLRVTGSLESPLAKALTLLQETPIRHVPDRIFQAFTPEGEAELDLFLQIPLIKDFGPTTVKGALSLHDTDLWVKDADLTIGKLNGELNFTENNMNARKLRGTLMGAPVTIDVATVDNDFVFALEGRADVRALQKIAPDFLADHAQGNLAYQLGVRIPKTLEDNNGPLRASFSSDLQGLTLNWPAPLGKTAETRMETRMELIAHSSKPARLSIAYGPELRGWLKLSSPAGGLKLESAELAYGRSPEPETTQAGVRLSARLSQLDLGPWKRWLNEGDFADSAPYAPVAEVSLEVDQLQFDAAKYGAVRMSAKKSVDSWNGYLDSGYGKGEFRLNLPDQGPPVLRLNLEQLRLPGQSQDLSGETQRIDPGSLPNLDLKSNRLFWHETDLGALSLSTHRDPAGMVIDHLKLDTPNHHLQLKGSWQRGERLDRTTVDGRMKVKDLGTFVTLLGYPKEIRDTPATGRFALEWPDAPQQFSAARVKGEVKLKLGRGSVPNLDPGLGRAFGVLNLLTLRRLLWLDFSDLFGKGLSYDGMKGLFRLENGQARTEGFLIDATAATILITGRAGLVTKDLDQKITVIPHTLATFPMAGAWVGGTTVSAAISAARGLFGQDSVSLTGNHYAVTGPWDDPKIERIAGNMPLDVLGNAWSGLKDISGLGTEQDEDNDE